MTSESENGGIVAGARQNVKVAVFEQTTQLDLNRVQIFEKHIVGSVCYHDEFEAAIPLLVDGRIRAEPLISAKITLEDVVPKGFEALAERKDENVKILVSPVEIRTRLS